MDDLFKYSGLLVLRTSSGPRQLTLPRGSHWILSSCMTASPPQVSHFNTTLTFPSSFVVYSFHYCYFTSVRHQATYHAIIFPINLLLSSLSFLSALVLELISSITSLPVTHFMLFVFSFYQPGKNPTLYQSNCSPSLIVPKCS